MAHAATQQPHGDQARRRALDRFRHFKTRECPDLAALPASFIFKAVRLDNDVRRGGQLVQRHARQRGGLDRRDRSEEKDENGCQDAVPVCVHFTSSPPVMAVLSLFAFSTNKVRGPVCAALVTWSVRWMIPSPSGCLAMMLTSFGDGPVRV